MHERPWWSVALQWTVWFVLMTLVMGWLARSRTKPRAAAERNAMRHPVGLLICGLVGFGFFAALAVITLVTDNPTATGWVTAVFAFFALLSLPLVLMYVLERHQVTDQGLAWQSMLGRSGKLEWVNLERVRYNHGMKWFRLDTGSGEVVRISVMLMGLPEFAAALLEAAPLRAIDADTRQILRATVAGEPPSIWG
jgi:hypothetical protein